jgi:hypothetical protein
LFAPHAAGRPLVHAIVQALAATVDHSLREGFYFDLLRRGRQPTGFLACIFMLINAGASRIDENASLRSSCFSLLAVILPFFSLDNPSFSSIMALTSWPFRPLQLNH